MSYYGNLILRERLARSWSQAGLCKDICTVSYLSKIETGKAQPSADVLRLLLARLGLHTDPALEAAGARCAEDGYERLFTGRFGELAAALPAVSDETYRATAAWTDLLLLRQFLFYGFFHNVETMSRTSRAVMPQTAWPLYVQTGTSTLPWSHG